MRSYSASINEEAVPINEMVRWAQVMHRGWPELTERAIGLVGCLQQTCLSRESPFWCTVISFGNLHFAKARWWPRSSLASTLATTTRCATMAAH